MSNSLLSYSKLVLSEDRDSESGPPHEKKSATNPVHSDTSQVEHSLRTTRSSPTLALMKRVRPTGSWAALALMLGSYVAAVAIVICHHIVLNIFNGKSVGDYFISQTWVRDIGNALSHGIQLLLETSVGVALTQSIWFCVRRYAATLPELDDIYSLPSLFGMTFTVLRLNTVYLFLLAVIIQARSLVSIFAPNALSLVPADVVTSSLRVPVPDLDMIPANDSAVFLQALTRISSPVFNGSLDGSLARRFVTGSLTTDNNTFVYISPSSRFKQTAQNVINTGAILPWEAPAGCGLACNYSVTYRAPSLRCQDIPQTSIEMVVLTSDQEANSSYSSPLLEQRALADSVPTAYISPSSLYNASTTLGYINNSDQNVGPVFKPTLDSTPYSLSVLYAVAPFDMATTSDALPNEGTASVNAVAGSYCVFYNATYGASISFSNGTQKTVVRVIEHGDPYPGALNGSFPLLIDVTSSHSFPIDPTSQGAAATLGIIDALSRYLTGSVSFTQDLGFIPLGTQVLDSSLFTVQTNNQTATMSIAQVRNLTLALEDVCTNLTASLMSITVGLGTYSTVEASVLPDKTVYKYQPYRLWLVYGIALFVALVADLFGLACLRSNGVAMQRKVSCIAASMRAPELNELLSGPEEPPREASKIAKLQYCVGEGDSGEVSGFHVVDGRGEVERREATSGLNRKKR
ncbi:unnamed protein product [Peniophora sp. CBMAI 1063]|nr:unnamed protein product [Peniophora sp. CBMAI 1063]